MSDTTMTRTLLILLFAASQLSLAVWNPPPPPVIVYLAAPLDASPDPRLLAIWDVESSAGTDCITSPAGAETCWQIKPATAEWVGCESNWRRRPVACAYKVREKGRELCRRQDVAGEAYFYIKGLCMPRDARPWGYGQRVLIRLPKYLREVVL